MIQAAPKTCPCCAQLVPLTNLIIDLQTYTAARLGAATHLRPAEAKILFALDRAFPETALTDRILFAMYGDEEGPDDLDAIVKVRMVSLRKKIAPLGVRIINVWALGYRLQFSDTPIIHVPLVSPKSNKRRRRRRAILTRDLQCSSRIAL